jgi:hypothetical protein
MFVGAAISAATSLYWPGWDGRAWKLWLVAALANPLLLVVCVFWVPDDVKCLVLREIKWVTRDCKFAGVGFAFGAAFLISPIVGLIVRWYWTRRRKA